MKSIIELGLIMVSSIIMMPVYYKVARFMYDFLRK